MATREEMLARIRRALGRSADSPHGMPRLEPADFPEIGDVMPAIRPEDIIPRFVSEFEKVSTKAWRANSLDALDAILSELARGPMTGSVTISRNPLLRKLDVEGRLKKLGIDVLVWPEDGVSPEAERAFRERCFTAVVGITGVDCALAETGSLVTSSLTEGAQLASLAPPVHVAIVRESQVVASLEDVLRGAAVSRQALSPSPGRSVVLITGSSRTADIEQIVIRGVHGPHEVHAILIGDACLA